jgi:hypothetical protein
LRNFRADHEAPACRWLGMTIDQRDVSAPQVVAAKGEKEFAGLI